MDLKGWRVLDTILVLGAYAAKWLLWACDSFTIGAYRHLVWQCSAFVLAETATAAHAAGHLCKSASTNAASISPTDF